MIDGRAAQEVGEAAATLLGSSTGASDQQLILALQGVLDAGSPAVAAFCRGFGPRRLMKRLANAPRDGMVEEEGEEAAESLADLADTVLTACLADGKAEGGGSSSSVAAGLGASQEFGATLHKEAMYPDLTLELRRPLLGQPLAPPSRLRSHAPAVASLAGGDASESSSALSRPELATKAQQLSSPPRLWLDLSPAVEVFFSSSLAIAYSLDVVSAGDEGSSGGGGHVEGTLGGVAQMTADLRLRTPSRRLSIGESTGDWGARLVIGSCTS